MTEREKFEQYASMPPREWPIDRQGSSSAWPGQYADYAMRMGGLAGQG